MVTMPFRRFGMLPSGSWARAARIVLAVPVGIAAASCGWPASGPAATGPTADGGVASSSDTSIPATSAPSSLGADDGTTGAGDADDGAAARFGPDSDADGDTDAEPDGAGSVEVGTGTGEVDAETGLVAGTDSPPPTDVDGGVDPALRARLADFGALYLAFDYRSGGESRLRGLEPLVTDELLGDLAAGVPEALMTQLIDEERVVEAELVEVRPLGPDAFELSMLVTEGRTDAGERITDSALTTLVVSVDAASLVSGVR